MSKELPYFKFEPDEWMIGDITLEKFNVQGVFVNVCAYYWKKDCDVSFDKLRTRYDKVSGKIWDILFEKKLIKNKNGKIIISFLLKQLQELNNSKEQKRLAGVAGAKKRWGDNSTPIKVPMAKHGNKEVDVEVEVDKKKKYNPVDDCWFFGNEEFVDAWKSWNVVRTKKKCSNTERTIKGIVKKLFKLSNQDLNIAINILDKSAYKGWTDLYEVDNNFHKQYNNQPVYGDDEAVI